MERTQGQCWGWGAGGTHQVQDGRFCLIDSGTEFHVSACLRERSEDEVEEKRELEDPGGEKTSPAKQGAGRQGMAPAPGQSQVLLELRGEDVGLEEDRTGLKRLGKDIHTW